MAKVYLGLGSNKGDRLGFLRAALTETSKLGRTSIRTISSVYETEPVGRKDQAEFLNTVAEIETTMPPHNLLLELKRIEKELGRMDRVKWGPREIDIDILYYDDHVQESDTLTIPHPYLHQRRFTLVPLVEIAPEFVHPMLLKTNAELLAECEDESEVVRI